MNLSKKLLFMALASCAALPAVAKDAQVGTGETDGYRLVWQDLFDDSELRSDRWNIEVNGSGGGNNELQFYTDRKSNVRLGDDGKGNHCLILTAVREVYNGKQFTSGRINSKNKVVFTHGKVEAAIRLPKTANGLWPAFWMMGNDFDQVGWPKCGETDIMEFGHIDGINGGVQDRYFNGACHWGQSWDNHPNYARAVTYDYSLQDGEFHIYTCIWNQERIAMYVDLDKHPDAKPYYEMTIPATGDTGAPGYYFHKENFILFNLAVGGNFPNIWDAAGITALNNGNGNQASMYVNYVKVYQKGTADESLNTLSPGDSQGGDNNQGGGNQGGDNNQGGGSQGGNESQYVCDPALSNTTSVGKLYDVVLLDGAGVESLRAAGKTVQDLRMDDANRFFYIWENTFAEADQSYPGVEMHTDGYTSLDVTNVGWSGAGFCIVNAAADLRHFTDDTHFHCGLRTTNGLRNAALIIGDGYVWGDNNNKWSPAKISVGSEAFVDNGTSYPLVGNFDADGEWVAVDITLGQLKKLWPSFNYKAGGFGGNILSFLAGGTTGKNISLDAVYFYTPGNGESAVAGVVADTDIIVTARTVNAAGTDEIALYNLAGQLVKKVNASIMGIEDIAAGIYIVKAGNAVKKVVLK